MSPIDPILLLRSLDTVSDLAFIFDRHCKTVYVNKAAQALGEATRAIEAQLEEVFRTKGKIVAQQTLACGEETLSFETVYTPILGDNGNAQFVIAISRSRAA